MKFPPLCLEQSIQEAKEAQRRERAAVTAATGIQFSDDGRPIQQAESDVSSARPSPDLTTN